MPQDLSRRLLHVLSLLVGAGLPNSIAQGLCEAGDDGGVVPSQIIQLDGLRDAVILGGVLRCAREDLCVEVPGGLEVEEGRGLLDDAALEDKRS